MSGQTARWRCLYSSMRSGRTCSWKQTRCTVSSFRDVGMSGVGPGRRRWTAVTGRVDGSEVEVVDVRLVEDERLAEQDHAVGADLERPEVTGVEGFALLAGDVSVGQRGRGVRGEVAQ